MPHDPIDMSALHDFLIDAHVLLTRAQECIQHLELIGNDADASDCLIGTLHSLATQASLRQQAQIAGFCRHLGELVAPAQCRNRLQGPSLNILQACLTLLAWQLELIDPCTGLLSMDSQEQNELLEGLAQALEIAPAPFALPN